MIQSLDQSISDDLHIRQLQIMEVALSNCAGVLWPTCKLKQKQAPHWAGQVREKIRSVSRNAEDNPDTKVHHPKLGMNGLSVVSADVVLYNCNSVRDSPVGSKTPPIIRNDRSPQEDTQRSPAISTVPNTAPMEVKAAREDFGGTAATTPDGRVIVVSSTGTPLVDPYSVVSPFSEVPLRVKRLSGGITNELFHVYDPADSSTSVVVRVFGKETERVISRESELFYQSLFITTYAYGHNFLVYDYLNGFETLPFTDMGVEARGIAAASAQFQVIATMAARRDFSPPLLRSEQNEVYWKTICADATYVGAPAGTGEQGTCDKRSNGSDSKPAATGAVLSRFDRESNYTVHSLTKWMDELRLDEVVGRIAEKKRTRFVQLRDRLRAESAEVLEILRPLEAQLPEGVCHNDILSGNVMRHTVTRELKLIDFDYTKRDYLLFDAGNHFNEYVGMEGEYDKYFPSTEGIALYIREYRAAMRVELAAAHLRLREQGANDADADIIPNERGLFWSESATQEEAVVAEWTKLAKFFSLCSHLSWIIWSLLQEAISDLDVDFLDYGLMRFEHYLQNKEKFLSGIREAR